MIALIPYILLLLTTSIIAMVLIFKVLIKQVGLYKYKIKDKNISHFRDVLLAISLTIIIMGMIPITINLYTLFIPSGRPPEVSTVSFIYTMGVHLQTLLLSYLLWRIYRLATGNFNDKDQE